MTRVNEVVRALAVRARKKALVASHAGVRQDRKHLFAGAASNRRRNGVCDRRGRCLGAEVEEGLVDRLRQVQLCCRRQKSAVDLAHRELHSAGANADAHVPADVVQELRLVIENAEHRLFVDLSALDAVKAAESLALDVPGAHDVERCDLDGILLGAQHRVLAGAVELIDVATLAFARLLGRAGHLHAELAEVVGVALANEVHELRVERAGQALRES